MPSPTPSPIASGVTALLARFAAGYAGAILAGVLVFGRSVLFSGGPPHACLTLGLLGSAVLALVRGGRARPALAVVLGNGLLQAGIAWEAGLPEAAVHAAAVVIVGGGFLIVALVYDELARSGLRLGKFLLVGPLVAGVIVAVVPLHGLVAAPGNGVAGPILHGLFLGLVIGDGMAAAVELVELLPLPGTGGAPSDTGM